MASENIITLKLLVHKVSQKVLYAEAPKEFVDFLFYLFSLPLGTLLQLVGSKQMAGCLDKLKESAESFDQIYFKPGINKYDIFNSTTTVNGNMSLLSNEVSANDKPATPKTVYTCGGSFKTYSYCRSTTLHLGTLCPACKGAMNFPLGLIGPPVVKEAEGKLRGGFVKDAVTYMVMDDLVVKPLSTIASINFINSCGVMDLTKLEEKTFRFGEGEALKLLKASLSTNAVLTTLLRQTKDA